MVDTYAVVSTLNITTFLDVLSMVMMYLILMILKLTGMDMAHMLLVIILRDSMLHVV